MVKIWKIILEIYTKILAQLGVDWDFFIKSLIDEILSLQQIRASFEFLYNPGSKKRNILANITPET